MSCPLQRLRYGVSNLILKAMHKFASTFGNSQWIGPRMRLSSEPVKMGLVPRFLKFWVPTLARCPLKASQRRIVWPPAHAGGSDLASQLDLKRMLLRRPDDWEFRLRSSLRLCDFAGNFCAFAIKKRSSRQAAKTQRKKRFFKDPSQPPRSAFRVWPARGSDTCQVTM